jgi:signal transduction histidine kinase
LWTSAQFFRRGNGRPVQGIVETVAAPAGMIRVAMVRGRPSLPDILGWVYDEVAFEVLPVVLPAMVLTLLIGAVTVRRAMAPLKRLSAAAGAIDPRQAGVRLAEDAVPREVLPLVQAMNRAIGRIELALQQQRRMTANAAHELRTPLAILRARLDGLPAGTGRDGLDRDVRRLSRLVEQLMTVSRLEAGQVAVDGTIDLVRVTREVLADAAPLAMAQGRAVELVAPGRAVMVPGNALALGDALMNLIDNALRHSPEGGTVEVAVEAAGAGDGRALPVVALEVRDRGPGIAAADRIQLFEPFWRGRDQHGKGSGLGLAIVAETVAVHGGTVSVQDRPGGGSVFRIELPAPEMVP